MTRRHTTYASDNSTDFAQPTLGRGSLEDLLPDVLNQRLQPCVITIARMRDVDIQDLTDPAAHIQLTESVATRTILFSFKCSALSRAGFAGGQEKGNK
jgi:hypothetical protein